MFNTPRILESTIEGDADPLDEKMFSIIDTSLTNDQKSRLTSIKALRSVNHKFTYISNTNAIDDEIDYHAGLERLMRDL